MHRSLLRAVLIVALAAAPVGSAVAEEVRDAALGRAGEVYVVQVGSYGELFPAAAPPADDDPVLAIDVLAPGASPVRLLVPDSEGPEAEGRPALVFEDASDSLYVVWESKESPLLSRINLASLKDEVWSAVVEVSGDVSPLKGSPQVAITRDAFATEGEEGSVGHVRTVLHIAWWEQADQAADEEVFYTPVVLEDGAYLGANRVVNLTALDPNPAADKSVGMAVDLRRSPVLGRGRDERSIAVGFASPRSDRFLIFEAQLVIGEVSRLGRQIHGFLLDQGDLYTAEGVGELADRARAHILEIGARLHPAVAGHLAREVKVLILSVGAGAPGGAVELADRARAHILEIGARLLGEGGLTAAPIAALDQVLEIGPAAAEGPPAALDHALRLRLASDRPAPVTGPGPTWVFLSEDGADALVSWLEEGILSYRETTADGWTEVRRLAIGGPITAARAESILRLRVREQ